MGSRSQRIYLEPSSLWTSYTFLNFSLFSTVKLEIISPPGDIFKKRSNIITHKGYLKQNRAPLP